MQNQSENRKLMKILQKRLRPQEVILDILEIYFYPKSSEQRIQTIIAMTSLNIYFIQNDSLKRQLSLSEIKTITISIQSNELVFHATNGNVRIESDSNIKIIKNILRVRQKLLKETKKFTINLDKEQYLDRFNVKEASHSLWNFIFKSKIQQPISPQPHRKPSVSLEISDKNFVLEIGKKVYQYRYLNVKLLYISGGLGFSFNEHNYIKQIYDQNNIHFQNRYKQKERILMRKILKGDQKFNQRIRKCLQNLRIDDSKQQIYYGIQAQKHFQILTPFIPQRQSITNLIQQQTLITQMDLVSIFYKMMNFIDNNIHILSSLSPKHIHIDRNGIIISTIFCIIDHQTNNDYLSPEELDENITESHKDIELINFWKIGMLIYQIAYGILPFPIQYLAKILKQRKNFKINFPSETQRSCSLQNFLILILQKQPSKRGGGVGWKKNIFDHEWLRKSMR